MPFKIGTRPSPLALVQVEEAVRFLRGQGMTEDVTIVPISSDGDLDKVTPFTEIEGSDFFTRQLEEALRNGAIDIAVHSAKDLENDPPADLTVALLTPSISPYECLVARGQFVLETLPAGSVVGTSSQKRAAALKSLRPDLVIKGIRGTIEERLAQMDKGDYDALIMAHAALVRLGLKERIAEVISSDIMPPHPLQGRLAFQVRAGDQEMITVLSKTAGVV